MVVFICDSCGESLKRNQVDKHCLRCRGCRVLSCVDCSKEFWGDDYKEHIKCVSEEEKYSGKDWKPKPGANKGEQKQNSWIEQVHNAISKSSNNPRLQQLLETLKDFSNIPRKKGKFENFLQNSVRIRDSNLVTKAWDVLSAEMGKSTPPAASAPAPSAAASSVAGSPDCEAASRLTEQGQSQVTAGADSHPQAEGQLSKRERKELRKQKQGKAEKKDTKQAVVEEEEESSNSKRKGKKRKHAEPEEEESNEDMRNGKMKKKNSKKHKQDCTDEMEQDVPSKKKKNENNDDSLLDGKDAVENHADSKFSWQGTIEAVLSKAPEKQMKLTKLKKKVLSQYRAAGWDGRPVTEEKLAAKFDKKLQKHKQIKIHKEKAQLQT